MLTIPVTPIYVEDPKGGFTIFFKEFPNVISEGETKEEALNNLQRTMHDVFSYKNTLSVEELDKL
jgi:predicted RNase H-like HicB family nuclease